MNPESTPARLARIEAQLESGERHFARLEADLAGDVENVRKWVDEVTLSLRDLVDHLALEVGHIREERRRDTEKRDELDAREEERKREEASERRKARLTIVIAIIGGLATVFAALIAAAAAIITSAG